MKKSEKIRRIAGNVIVGVLGMQAVLSSQAEAQSAAPPNTVVATQPASVPMAPSVDWSRAVVDSKMKRYPGYEHRVSIKGPDDFPLVAGFSRKPDLKEIDGKSPCSLAIWGHQVVQPGIGATESLPDQNLGLAILAPDTPAACQIGDPQNYLVKPQIKDGTALWYVLAAWDQETPQPVGNVKDLTSLVKQESVRLLQPASVTMLASPQAASTTISSQPTNASQNVNSGKTPPPPSPDGVKYFSSTEVHAAFEKGAPLLAKDGHTYWVTAGRRDKPGQSELHEKDTDVFYILQGSATFVTGGKMVEPRTTAPGEIRGTAIEGGDWFKDVQGLFLYFVVKVQ